MIMDVTHLLLMQKEDTFQVTAKSQLTKCLSMLKMNTFLQRQNLATIKQVEEQEKGNQPSTSMAKHARPSAPTEAAVPAAAGGPKWKRKRWKGSDTVSVTVQREKIVQRQMDEYLLMTRKIEMVYDSFTINMENLA